MTQKVERRSYKEVRLQQLRSFCETARLGSLAAAADALDLAQPTVWEQVHSLEREFAAKLVEPHGRGCRLTEAGRLLAQMAVPLVAGIDALKPNFEKSQAQRETWLTIAATPRTFVDDLPEPLFALVRRYPNLRLRFLELGVEDIAPAVEAREADLGLTTNREPHPPNPWLAFEPVYELDTFLVTPQDHPLARRRRVTPRDLRPFPLLNAPGADFADPVHVALLDKLGVFQTQPRRVEASHTVVIRRYVEMGFGIGLLLRLAASPPSPHVHERSMSRYFGRMTINLIWRKGAPFQEHIRAVADALRDLRKSRAKR